MSTKTGTPPRSATALAVDGKVNDGTITSSPGPSRRAAPPSRARPCRSGSGARARRARARGAPRSGGRTARSRRRARSRSPRGCTRTPRRSRTGRLKGMYARFVDYVRLATSEQRSAGRKREAAPGSEPARRSAPIRARSLQTAALGTPKADRRLCLDAGERRESGHAPAAGARRTRSSARSRSPPARTFSRSSRPTVAAHVSRVLVDGAPEARMLRHGDRASRRLDAAPDASRRAPARPPRCARGRRSARRRRTRFERELPRIQLRAARRRAPAAQRPRGRPDRARAPTSRISGNASRTPAEDEAGAAADLEHALARSGSSDASAQTIRLFRDRNQKLSSSSLAEDARTTARRNRRTSRARSRLIRDRVADAGRAVAVAVVEQMPSSAARRRPPGSTPSRCPSPPSTARARPASSRRSHMKPSADSA